MKDLIKNFAKDVGVDDIGFASIENYNSPNTPPIKEIYSKAKIIIVLAFQQLDNCENENIGEGDLWNAPDPTVLTSHHIQQ